MALAALPVPVVALPAAAVSPAATRMADILNVAAATDVPLLTRVIPDALSLHTVVLSVAFSTGSGSTVRITVTISPVHGFALTGIISYSTVRLPAVVLVKTSPAMALAALPVPVVALPAAAVSPAATRMADILNVAAATDVPLLTRVIPDALSLHTVVLSVAFSTGSGSTVRITVTKSPVHGFALTGIISYSTVRLPPVLLVKTSATIALANLPVPIVALPAAAVSPAATRMSDILKVAAATDVPLLTNVIPEALSLHTVVLSVALSTGSGSTVRITVTRSPVHGFALTGIISYSTVRL